jgi:hypothetical protein
MGHALMENRSELIVAATLTKATSTAEREAAEAMIVRHSPGARRITLGADKGYYAVARNQDRLLKGEKPADLPVPAPTKMSL